MANLSRIDYITKRILPTLAKLKIAMMLLSRYLCLSIILVSSILPAYAQRLSDVLAMDGLARRRSFAEAKTIAGVSNRDFLKFYIPSAILFSGIEPAAVSKFNVGFGKDRVELKLGKPFKTKIVDPELKNSVGLKLSASAPSGTRTLFQYDNTPRDFDATLAFTNLLKQETGGIDSVHIYNQAKWLNVHGTIGTSKKILFSDDVTYTQENYTTYSIMVSLNWFYNGYFSNLPSKRRVLHLGVGFGTFDNYNGLSKYTLRKGVVAPDGTWFGETSAVSGRKGVLEKNSGLLLTGAAFKPVSKFDAPTNVMLGINVNSFGTFELVSANAGIYISGRSYDQVKKQLKEDYSFGILADFTDVASAGESNYVKKNFQLLLVAQVPIRFSK